MPNVKTLSLRFVINVLQINGILTQKIINLRKNHYEKFKESKALIQIPDLNNLDWKEWEQERFDINSI